MPTAALHCWCLQELLLAVPPVVPATKGAASFSTVDFTLLGSFVDGFSVMSYDYGTSFRGAGPNAPLWWLRENVHKALAGHRYVLHGCSCLQARTALCNQPQLVSQAIQLKTCWCRGLPDKFLMGLNFYGERLCCCWLLIASGRILHVTKVCL